MTSQQVRELNDDFRANVTPKMIQDRASRYNISYQEAEDQMWNEMKDDREQYLEDEAYAEEIA